MNNHDSASKVEARKNQEDPIVMYIIVRESLGMGVGKIAAQCAHASQMLTLEYFRDKKIYDKLQAHVPSRMYPEDRAERSKYLGELDSRLSIMDKWLNSSFRKVVLKADDKEWEKIKTEYKNNMVLVVDAGLTEIPSGSETVIGLWAMHKSEVSKTIKKLQILK